MWSLNWQSVLGFALPFAVVIGGLLIGFFLERWLGRLKRRFEGDNSLARYAVIFKSFQGVVAAWVCVAAVALFLPLFNFPHRLSVLTGKILLVIALATGTILVSRLAVNLIRLYSFDNETSVSLTSLFESLTRVVVFTIGTLIIFQSLGIKITALLTALGIGSLSIGLAFQNTLSNLISGINIIISRKVRPGDYIQLADGIEGYVEDVELKYTVIKDIYCNRIIIPNAKIIDSSFRNYTLVDPFFLFPVKLVVEYENDLELVEEVTLKLAQKLQESFSTSKGHGFHPFITYEKFEYWGIRLIVYLGATDYFQQHIMAHEFIKALHREYRKMGIKMARPPLVGEEPES
ncbi:MAG: mechanosensitive ion channel family protein [Geminocystis sp.]|nr:mechanosensitive ion channel family protein [Geminocystis sp.]MCS7147171.1 mechanosensitive ion channel family protein [Geminocystis sp.]MDW8116167.1 mechanosensitive ion channel family protein [Geminocystis sp.]MDW8462841.1 mechanosensitive ion channel family protein [Geminocystis sp.]